MKLKKFLSFTLALITVLSLLPVMALAAEGQVYEYVFGSDALGIDANSQAGDQVGKTTKDGVTPSWTFVQKRGLNGGRFNANSLWYTVKSSNLTEGANGMVFTIMVPEAGVYSPSITVGTGNTNTVWKYYLIKAEETDNFTSETNLASYIKTTCANATPFGVIDCYADTTAQKTEKLTPVVLEAGKYNFVMTTNELKNTSETYVRHDLYSLKLSSLSSLEATADKTALALGETANITTKATFADATELALDAAAVT